jgi:hypothetical protein
MKGAFILLIKCVFIYFVINLIICGVRNQACVSFSRPVIKKSKDGVVSNDVMYIPTCMKIFNWSNWLGDTELPAGGVLPLLCIRGSVIQNSERIPTILIEVYWCCSQLRPGKFREYSWNRPWPNSQIVFIQCSPIIQLFDDPKILRGSQNKPQTNSFGTFYFE